MAVSAGAASPLISRRCVTGGKTRQKKHQKLRLALPHLHYTHTRAHTDGFSAQSPDITRPSEFISPPPTHTPSPNPFLMLTAPYLADSLVWIEGHQVDRLQHEVQRQRLRDLRRERRHQCVPSHLSGDLGVVSNHGACSLASTSSPPVSAPLLSLRDVPFHLGLPSCWPADWWFQTPTFVPACRLQAPAPARSPRVFFYSFILPRLRLDPG